MPDVKELSINDLIPQSLELIRTVLKRKEIKIELHLDSDLPKVAADAKQIQQVIINLITNAADAIKSKGKIVIESYIEKAMRRGEGEYAVVSVKDDGIGISTDDLRKIFNPFFTRKADGTGLGLPITQRIMHQHNGIIDVESKQNEGTTFYVKLPIPYN